MKHRADTHTKTHLAPMEFKPRHCAGTTGCLHDHAGASPALPPMGTFRQRIAARITGRDKRLAPVETVGRAS